MPARNASVTGAHKPIDVITSPCNLGLRPDAFDNLAGTWRAADVLLAAGLARGLNPRRTVALPQLEYHREAEAGTRVRNGNSLRRYSEAMAAAVEQSLDSGGFALVVGGDCSNLLGCLYGLRRAGGRGLVHLDGHSDFYHPGNYDAQGRLGSVAGMDLAVVTGRGEPIVTQWPGMTGPLVADADVIQIGEREREDADYPFHEIAATDIFQLTVQEAHAQGLERTIAATLRQLEHRRLTSTWLHVDLDVLDQEIMPAVDSPGSPGFSYAELTGFVSALLNSGRIAGMDIAIYDPDLDPELRYADQIAEALRQALGGG